MNRKNSWLLGAVVGGVIGLVVLGTLLLIFPSVLSRPGGSTSGQPLPTSTSTLPTQVAAEPTTIPTPGAARPTAEAPTPEESTTAGAIDPQEFLQAQGSTLVYRGVPVILKGTNYDNVGALGARIGTGDVNDIYYDEADYAAVAEHGANHVRFGMSFIWYQRDRDRFFEKMDEQVAWARKHNLWLVFNQFTTPNNCYEGYSNHCGIWSDPDEQQELLRFWVDMATRYKDEPAVAGYDLLNEPFPPDSCDTWFAVAGRIRDAVHAVAPNQLVFIASCDDPVNNLSSPNLPRGANIVYQVHDYMPLDMTHDFWTPGSVYPGYAEAWFGRCYYNKAVFAGEPYPGDMPLCTKGNLRETYGLNWAQQQNVPIYIGEWGSTARLQGYAQLETDKAELYRDWGVHHAHYTWKAQTIVTGGEYQSGIYADTPDGPRLDDTAKLAAVKIAWAGAVRPDFGSPAEP